VGLKRENIKASLSPQDKASIISSLQSEGHSVAMVMICLVNENERIMEKYERKN
jgi:soluble P-type ATPase